MDFSNLNDLAKEIQRRANIALKTDVAPVVTQEMSEVIKDVEYPKYTPTEYVRLGDDGGLSDVRLMQVEVLNDNTISITNERMDGSRDVAQIFASGVGYEWRNSEIYQMQPFPRDFYADTVLSLLRNRLHIQGMKKGLERQGLKVE
jgi:hypothetical protein